METWIGANSNEASGPHRGDDRPHGHGRLGIDQYGRQAGGESARGKLAARESRPPEGAAPPSDPPVRRNMNVLQMRE